jgi:hypothetical protein
MTILKRTAALLLCAVLLISCALAEEALPRTETVQLGEGANEMTMVVVFPDGLTRVYHLRSDCDLLVDALLALELIQVLPEEEGEGLTLVAVDGVPLPADDPDAYWFIAVNDPQQDTLVPCTEPLETLPFAGQTYALGLIAGLAVEPLPEAGE